MIVFVMVTLLVVALTAAGEALASSRRSPGRVVLAGIGAGALAFNASLYPAAYPGVSVALLGFALAVAVIVGWQQRRHMVRLATVTVVVVAASVLAWQGGILLLERTHTRPVDTVNAQSTGPRAVIVYQPGGTGFQDLVTGELASGLAEQGWRVDRVTASPVAPTDLAGVRLLVVSTPTYDWGEPTAPIRRYLSEVGHRGELRDVAVVTITTAVGQVAGTRIDDVVRSNGGPVDRSLVVYTTAPNSDVSGTDDHRQIMRELAADLAARHRAGSPA